MQRRRRICDGNVMVLDLRPGPAIGPFSLGKREDDSIVEKQNNVYDVVHVKHHDGARLKFDLVRNGEILDECGRAVIQAQGSTTNHFRSTFVYAYPKVAFMVMKYGDILTVTLFQ